MEKKRFKDRKRKVTMWEKKRKKWYETGRRREDRIRKIERKEGNKEMKWEICWK